MDDKSERASPAADSDLGLDPSDPLNLLLHNSPSDSSSMDEGASPPDWSQLSALWPSYEEPGSNNNKSDLVDIDMGIMDINSTTIDPNALHPFGFGDKLGFGLNDDLLSTSSSFPFTFQQLNSTPSPVTSSRRLSITSSSSSSGASLSPVIEPKQPTTEIDPAAALAQRVRESAGVMLAVPMNGQQLQQQQPQPVLHVIPNFALDANVPSQMPTLAHFLAANSFQSAAAAPPPLPITTSPVSPSTSSAASTPPPPTPPSSTTGGGGGTMGVIARPKTSHTTIERRYRTNLNARIQSLRNAVPALRVLEDREGNTRRIKVGVREETDGGDVVDERGFVDGVKVARKCSKANVLGKAVEYIRVLKKREARLKREQEGLKTLLCGLVGGPALLREWEREWREKFGGPEKDEVEGGNTGDADDSDDSDDDEEEGARKRKKPKVTPPPPAAVTVKQPKKPAPPPPQPQTMPDGTVVVPEKRKRGRPRKVQQPPAESLTPATSVPFATAFPPVEQKPQVIPGATQTQQYLLAVFALFSFFNSPLTAPSPSHSERAHTGHVVNPHAVSYDRWGWHEVVQSFHLLVSILIFASIVLPWVPPLKKGSFSLRVPSFKNSSSSSSSRSRSVSLAAALAQDRRGTEDEAEGLRQALSSSSGVFDALLLNRRKSVGFEEKGLEQRAWVRLGEICVFRGDETSYLTRLTTFWHMRSHLSWFASHACELSTLALLVYPLNKSRARTIWDEARRRKGVSGGVAHERLVLESLSVDEAAERLKKEPSNDSRRPPIGVLAVKLMKEKVHDHLRALFVRTVLGAEEDATMTVVVEEKEVRRSIDAARSLGGKVALIGESLERVWNGECFDVPELEGEEDLVALLRALVLYRKVFPSCVDSSSGISILLSPPPSPNGRADRDVRALRWTLGSTVFETDPALEDARDRVVDLLVDSERRTR